MQVGKSEVPNFIKSPTAPSLRRLMFEECARRGAAISFFSIQFVNGYWYAWFYIPMREAFEKEKTEIEKNEK